MSNKLEVPDSTSALIEFCCGLTLSDIPQRVVDHSRRSLLDFLALTVSATSTDGSRIVRGAVIELGGHAQARLLGFGDWTNVTQAALLAGVSGHIQDFDDTHIPTILHPTTPVLAAAFPVGEWQGVSGRALLEAYVVGVEVGARVALTLGREHYDRGWHVTGTAGTVAAAAAAARLLNLDALQTSHALGAATTQAAGLREQFGFMTKSLHAGAAASNGVTCALLAQRGFTASASSFDGRRGMLSVMGGAGDTSQMAYKLGDDWELDRTGFKPYACGVVTHPALDAIVRLRQNHGVSAGEIDQVTLTVHPLVVELTGKLEPSSGLEGKFSIVFAASIALLEGKVTPDQFTDETVTRADSVGLQRRIRVVVDGALQETQASVSVLLQDGRVITERVEAALGTPGNPMGDEDIRAKARALLDPVLGAGSAQELVELTARVESLETVSPLVDATLMN